MTQTKVNEEKPKSVGPVDVLAEGIKSRIEAAQEAERALLDEVRAELAPHVLAAGERIKIFEAAAPEIRVFIGKVNSMPWDKVGGEPQRLTRVLNEMVLILDSVSNQFLEAKSRIENLKVSELKGQNRQWVPGGIIALLRSSDGALSRLHSLRSEAEGYIVAALPAGGHA